MLSVTHTLTGEQLTDYQLRLERHLAFSITEGCPLRCEHCIVSTVLPAEAARFTVPPAQARRYADEMPALRARGIDRISFTGGEPLLAGEVLGLLSEAAGRSAIECTVVTACHWAKTIDDARRVVRSYPYLTHWHLSADVFHQKFLPLQFVVNAATAALETGHEVLIRMAARWPISDEDTVFYGALVAALPPDAKVAVQQISKSGRASEMDLDVPTGNAKCGSPCMSTGLVVRYDGTVSPCCSALIDERDTHPFQYAAANVAGVGATYDAWRGDPLLKLIRCIGFDHLLQWVCEDNPDHPVLQAVPDHPCELCHALWTVPGTAAAVRARVSEEPVQRKISALYDAVFGPQGSTR